MLPRRLWTNVVAAAAAFALLIGVAYWGARQSGQFSAPAAPNDPDAA